jgi:hypothetical protein
MSGGRRIVARKVLLATSMLISLTSVQADERRRSGTDTARHPSIVRDGGTDDRVGAGSNRGAPPMRRVPVDPAVEQYWSNKCLQQRARGWGHTGDCDSPAYTGGGRDLYRGSAPRNGRGYGRYPGTSTGGYYRGRPSHPGGEPVIIVPENRGGDPYVPGRAGRGGFSGNR